MLISLKLHVNIESMVEEQVYFLITIFLNPLDQKLLVAPLFQMLTLLGLKDDFFADFAQVRCFMFIPCGFPSLPFLGHFFLALLSIPVKAFLR